MLRSNYHPRGSGHFVSGVATVIKLGNKKTERCLEARLDRPIRYAEWTDERSVPGDFIGASDVIAPQQGFPGSDY